MEMIHNFYNLPIKLSYFKEILGQNEQNIV